MLEIFGFSVAVVAIGTLARGRKISFLLAGSLVIAIFLLIRLAALLLARDNEETFFSVFGAWAWAALVVLFLKFMVAVRTIKKLA